MNSFIEIIGIISKNDKVWPQLGQWLLGLIIDSLFGTRNPNTL